MAFLHDLVDHRDRPGRNYGLGVVVQQLLIVTGCGLHTGLRTKGAGRAGDLAIGQGTEETRPAINDNRDPTDFVGTMLAAGAL
jgi:hypothetical protein